MSSANPPMRITMPAGSGNGLTLRLAPLIDIVFLLLIFFLLTANFQPPEDHLPTALPEQADEVGRIMVEPLLIRLDSDTQGNCLLQVGSGPLHTLATDSLQQDFARWGEALLEIIQQQGRYREDPVRLAPAHSATWDHVVRTYEILWRLGMTNITFS